MKKLNLEAFQAKLNEQEQAKVDALCEQLLGNGGSSQTKARSSGAHSI